MQRNKSHTYAALALLVCNTLAIAPAMADGESITPGDDPIAGLVSQGDDTNTQSRSIGDVGHWGTCSNGWTLESWERFGAKYYCHWVKYCSNYTRVAITTWSFFTCLCPLTKPNCSKTWGGGAGGVGN